MILPMRPQDTEAIRLLRRLMRVDAKAWRRLARHRRTFYCHHAAAALRMALAYRDAARRILTGGLQ